MSGLQLAELWLIGTLLAIGVSICLWFVVVYARSPWARSPAGRHLMAMTTVTGCEFLTLLLMLVGVPVPLWVFCVGYLFFDAVLAQRLVLLYRARKEEKQKTG